MEKGGLKNKAFIGLGSCLLLCALGCYQLLTEPVTFSSILFGAGGFIGSAGVMMELYRKKRL